jgi:hypothetical protein
LPGAAGVAPERGEAGLADVRNALANGGGRVRFASQIVFPPSHPPGRIVRAGLESLGYLLIDPGNEGTPWTVAFSFALNRDELRKARRRRSAPPSPGMVCQPR